MGKRARDTERKKESEMVNSIHFITNSWLSLKVFSPLFYWVILFSKKSFRDWIEMERQFLTLFWNWTYSRNKSGSGQNAWLIVFTSLYFRNIVFLILMLRKFSRIGLKEIKRVLCQGQKQAIQWNISGTLHNTKHGNHLMASWASRTC